MRRVLLTLVFLLSLGSSTSAQTAVCDALTAAQRHAAERLLATEYLYDCCDDTIAACLEEQPTCALAVRLADNVCRRLASGQDEDRIRRALSRRARSMVGGGAQAEIDLGDAPVVGDAGAPVSVVVYACARCPYCSKLVPALHREITSGSLRGEARLFFRTFPIRGHPGSTEAGMAFAAAAGGGRFWEFLLYAYQHFDDFAPEVQVDWARAAGLEPEAFAARMVDPATREALVESKKEGLRNGVEETPTLFLDGRRWVGDLEVGEVVDAIEEEAARLRGESWVTP